MHLYLSKKSMEEFEDTNIHVSDSENMGNNRVTYICTWNRCNYLQTSSLKKICHACNTYIYNNKTDTHPLFPDPNKAQSTWMSKADPFSHLFNVWICKLAGTSKCTQTMKASNFPTTVVNCSHPVLMSIIVTVHTVNSRITVKYIIYLLSSFSEPGNILSQLCHQII